MRRLPPLGALRAFEAAARHSSFTAAAAELCVTQAAVSHQIRQLEDWLGLPLFVRRGHTLTLTEKGRAYVGDLTRALDLMASATLRVRERVEGPLRMTVLPSFASRWLVPRLARFSAQHPDIDVRLTSSAELWAGNDDRYDVAIRSGLGRWPGLKADLIARETLSPVCAPCVAAGERPLVTPGDLQHVALLHDAPKAGWRHWCEHVGVEGIDTAGGLAFDDASLALQAAVQGQGVALARMLLAADDLAAGRLVQPFDMAMPNDYSYWLAYRREKAARPDVAAFRSWLLAQAREARTQMRGWARGRTS
jgi:LysR family glycine cleavage system transcriptional activator